MTKVDCRTYKGCVKYFEMVRGVQRVGNQPLYRWIFLKYNLGKLTNVAVGALIIVWTINQ